jgi:hypothetical protein
MFLRSMWRKLVFTQPRLFQDVSSLNFQAQKSPLSSVGGHHQHFLTAWGEVITYVASSALISVQLISVGNPRAIIDVVLHTIIILIARIANTIFIAIRLISVGYQRAIVINILPAVIVIITSITLSVIICI